MVSVLGAAIPDLASQTNSQASGQRAVTGVYDSLSGLPHIDDLIDISDEAFRRAEDGRRAIADLISGQRDLRQGDIDFLKRQLGELQKQIELLTNLTTIASPEQSAVLDRGIQDLGGKLQSLGRQINGALQVTSKQVSVEAISASFSSTFNGVAVGEKGAVGYSQELNVEFSFLRVRSSEQTATLQIGEDGSKSLEYSSQQTETIVTQINIESTQTVVAQSAAGLEDLQGLVSQLESLAADFTSTSQSFIDILRGYNDVEAQADRIPPGFLQLLATLEEKISIPAEDA